jgi:hypothetical protein
VVGFCEHGNKPSDSIRRRDISEKLSDSFLNNILHHGVSNLFIRECNIFL